MTTQSDIPVKVSDRLLKRALEEYSSESSPALDLIVCVLDVYISCLCNMELLNVILFPFLSNNLATFQSIHFDKFQFQISLHVIKHNTLYTVKCTYIHT